MFFIKLKFIISLIITMLGLMLGFVFIYISSNIKNKKNQYCPNCGVKVKDKYKYCNNCGEKLHLEYDETAYMIFEILGYFVIGGSLVYLLFNLLISLVISIIL